jgi:oxygen-dependent protoporphyrinogen oxidase
MRRVVIVGGGISGLSAAYYLRQAGIVPTLIERRPRLGGVIETEHVEGCVLEAGPDSFLAQKPWALELIREVGLGGDVIGSNDHLRVTYVWKNGRMVPLPDGLMLMIPTKILPLIGTGLLSWGTKIRMGLEWFRKPARAGDRSVAEFVADHYGQEAVDYLAEPLLAGVYGGDPNQLSVTSVLPRFIELEAQYGSLTRGVLHARRKVKRQAQNMPLFQTLKGGLGQLVDVLREKAAPTVIQGEAEAIEPGWRVRVDGAWIEAEHVVLACPAYEAGALLGGEVGPLLNAIPYTSSNTIALVYDRKALNHPLNGFGFLVPRRERRRLMACTWVGTKFSHRVPDHLAVLRCFATGETPAVEEIREELKTYMGVTAEPRFTRVSAWPRSMAQYTVGHARRVGEIDSRMLKLPGLYLAGNAYSGIGIPDCVRMGKAAAERIVKA